VKLRNEVSREEKAAIIASELINDATGMTMFMISTKPKEIVVVGSR
jgi:hypothetical protein